MIQPTSLVTLNFRLRQTPTGEVLMSTFESTPATLQLGTNELSATLEACLHGLLPGARRTFDLADGEAFGPYRTELVEHVKRSDIPADMHIEADTILGFTAPDGSTYPGLVREVNASEAIVDFNHPLAGKAVQFEVEIIGVL